MQRTLHYYMNTSVRTAIIPLYIKEYNLFYLLFDFGNINRKGSHECLT